jgi:membrane protein YfhO
MFRNQVSVSKTFDRVCLAVTALLILWFCQDLVLHESVPFFRDLSTYFYPLRFSLYESYRAGTLPLWDGHMAMGFPVLADFQSGVFYPIHFLFLTFPFFTAVRIIFVCHFLIAAVGAYRLFRHWNYPYPLALLGALLFSLGGTMVSLTNLLNHFETAVWLPWVILMWERVVRMFSWNKFLTFVLMLCVQFLAGSPELFALSMVLVLVAGFRIKASEPEITYGRIILIFIGASLLLIALTMAQLLPSAELFWESRRHQPIPSQEALSWSLRPLSLANFFFLDKEVDLSNPIGLRFFFADAPPFFISYYLGTISFFGICLWLYLSAWREKIALFVLLIGSLLISFGSYTPIYPFLLRFMPILSAFRFPEKIFFFSYALFIYAIVKGLGELSDCDRGRFKKAVMVLSAVCVAWVGLYLYVWSNLDGVANLMTRNASAARSTVVQAKLVAAVLANLERQIILSLAFLLLLALSRSEKVRGSLVAVLLVSTTFVDLAWAHRDLLFLLDPESVYNGPRILREPDHHGNRLFYYPSDRNLHPSRYTVRGQPSFQGVTKLFFQNLLPNSGILYGFDYFQEIDALARRPYTEFLSFANKLDTPTQIRLLRIFTVGYLIAFAPLTTEGITPVAHFPEYFSWLYKIDQAVPRVYVVGTYLVENNGEQTLRRLASPAFDPTKEVILGGEVRMTPKRKLVATATIVDYQNQAMTIHASLNDTGILILADSYYPGWKAYVDGRQEPILKANHFFRAVVLPEGKHVVEFRYEPLSFKIGAIISSVTILILASIPLVVSMRRWKHRGFGTARR